MLEAWLDGMLHFPPFDTNRFKPSIDICDGLTLSKNGFNIWAQIESFIDSDIISKQRAIFPFFPLKNPRYTIKNKIGMVQLSASVIDGITWFNIGTWFSWSHNSRLLSILSKIFSINN